MSNQDAYARFADLFEQYNQKFYDLIANLKQRRRASIEGDIDEKFYSPNDTFITVQPLSQNVVRITSVIILLTSNGTLTIGDRVIPLSTGVYQWRGLNWTLDAKAARTLSQQATGAIGLELMGENLVNTGVW